MKNLFITLSTIIIALCYANNTRAQSYLSKSLAVSNLAEEAKYVAALLPELQDTNAIVMQRNRLRIISALLHDLKSGAEVEASANRYVPSPDLQRLQVGVGQFSPPTAGYSNHLAWLEADIMQLLTE